MGKARIVAHEGKGLYTVDIEVDTVYLEQLQQQANAEYTRILFKELPDAQINESTQASILADAQAAVDLAIFNYQTTPTEANFNLIDDAAKEAIKKSAGYRNAKQVLDSVNSRLNALRKKLEILRDNDQTTKRSALWCVDLADGKKDRKLFYPGDEIGTIEISGQDSIGQTLQPSFVHGWEYSLIRDGFLESVHGLTPFEYLYNWTLLPPWQTWKHRYRSGEIIGGNPTDGWTVRLDNTKSITSSIEINNIAPDRTLTGIHAQYMSCNDLAFGLKDHVVLDVAISGPPNATVISAIIVGFVEKPKPCLNSGFGYYALETDGSPAEWQHINDETGAWVKLPSYANDLTAHAFDVSGEPTVRSWIGDDIDSDAPVLEFIENGSAIYQSGIKLADIPTSQSYRILGAALSPKRKYLWAIFTYSSASNKIWLARYGLDIDPSLKDDTTGGDHTVILSATLKAKSSFNGQVVIDSDALLSGSLTAKATASGVLSVTPGWEMEEFDLGANAPVGGIGGQFSFNASCTRALSMWDFVHGAKRTPQAAPSGGGIWRLDVQNYDDFWKEKLEITIAAPDAKTMVKAGVALTNHGRVGYIVQNIYESTIVSFGDAVLTHPIIHLIADGRFIRDYCYPATAVEIDRSSMSGSYQIGAAFVGDAEIRVDEIGFGESSGSMNQSETPQVTDNSSNVITPYVGAKTTIGNANIGIKTNVDGKLFNKKMFVSSGSSYTNNAADNGANFYTSSNNYSQTNGFTEADINNLTTIHNEIEQSNVSTTNVQNILGACYWTYTSITTTGERGELWCADARIDLSIGDPSSVDDAFEDGFKLCNYGFTSLIQCFHDNYSDGGDAPPLQEPEYTPVEPTDISYDVTAYDDGSWSTLIPSNPYEKVQGARAAGRKHMAYWQNTRTPGSVREYKAYLTGGDPFALDGLTNPVIYRAIHPL